MNILLVEPNYKNKYPPLGLMKISAYHKIKGDNVYFIKGTAKDLPYAFFDRVYITTLFTFYFDLTVNTIRYYKKHVKYVKDIFVGGILATILKKNLIEATGINNVISGLLLNSKMLGFDDNINIDCLTPDYDIMDEINYKYPAGNNYFAYTTRGCPNHCNFCAVPILEPKFKTTNNIYNQIKEIDMRYGKRRNLLLLDNNVLYSSHLKQIIEDIKKAGFENKPSYIEPLEYDIFINSYQNGFYVKSKYKKVLQSLFDFIPRIKNIDDLKIFKIFINEIVCAKNLSKALWKCRKKIEPILLKYRNKVLKQRYVDFNQGIDASLLDDYKLKLLSEIPVRPLRIAFDSWESRAEYEKAVRLAASYGFHEISNYMLYNFEDKPEELWHRINLNTILRQEIKVNLFSFPMKYTPVDVIDRKYIGRYWNRKYLRAIQAILLVKKGIVSTNKDFVEKAFGSSLMEFFEILMMPEDFIIYRMFFEKNGLTQEWKEKYRTLKQEDKLELLELVKIKSSISGNINKTTNKNIINLLHYYLYSYEKILANERVS